MARYTVTVTDPRHQEFLAYLQEKLVAEFVDMYGDLPFTLAYVFSFTPVAQTTLTIPVKDPRYWELLVYLQDKLVASFTEMYDVAPPTITYTLEPG